MSIKNILLFCAVMVVVRAKLNRFTMDERWVCGVKTSCFECLKLAHCSWCKTENKCFSQKLSTYENYCVNNTVNHDEDYGLSLEENAECLCSDGKKDLHCYPPGTTEGVECSARGKCKCGHCICDSNPDPANPTKTIMGEYCEFDNFSCDGPKCNEGPYSISQPVPVDGDDDFEGVGTDDIDDTRR